MAIAKREKAWKDKLQPGKQYSIDEALKLVKEFATAKFNETVDCAVNLGIDAAKSDQQVRGSTVMPHGTGKTLRVAVFTAGKNVELAKAAGADIVGMEDLAAQVKAGEINFDRVIASPDAMRVVGQLGQILGPRGLMPNPKVGTVTPDVATAVKNAKAGQVTYRVDKAGIIHCIIGKSKFEAAHLKDNLIALINDLNKAKPATSKGIYLQEDHRRPRPWVRAWWSIRARWGCNRYLRIDADPRRAASRVPSKTAGGAEGLTTRSFLIANGLRRWCTAQTVFRRRSLDGKAAAALDEGRCRLVPGTPSRKRGVFRMCEVTFVQECVDMPLNLEDKKVLVAEVTEVAKTALSVVAAEYRGLTVTQMTDLRAKARASGVYMRVVKNTLARKAFAGTAFEPVGPKLKGPLVLAFSKDDPGAAARVVKAFSKDNDKLVATLVSIGGEVLSAQGPREGCDVCRRAMQALSQLLGVLKAPIQKFVGTLAAPNQKLVRTIAAVRDAKPATA